MRGLLQEGAGLVQGNSAARSAGWRDCDWGNRDGGLEQMALEPRWHEDETALDSLTHPP